MVSGTSRLCGYVYAYRLKLCFYWLSPYSSPQAGRILRYFLTTNRDWYLLLSEAAKLAKRRPNPLYDVPLLKFYVRLYEILYYPRSHHAKRDQTSLTIQTRSRLKPQPVLTFATYCWAFGMASASDLSNSNTLSFTRNASVGIASIVVRNRP